MQHAAHAVARVGQPAVSNRNRGRDTAAKLGARRLPNSVKEARKGQMDPSEKEEDAILRMLIYLKYELTRNSFHDQVILIDDVISSIESEIRRRRE